MTRKHLRALEHLPAVIDALEALAADHEKLRRLMEKTSPVQRPALQAVDVPWTAPPPVDAGPINLDTPERREHEEAKKKQREVLEALRRDPQRKALLSQFAHDDEAAQ